MQGRIVMLGSALVSITAALGACYGTMDGTGQADPATQQSLELVASKRDWLKNYDGHCNACFQAFALCEKGAVDATEEDACQVALDACVRGGLKNENDAGVDVVDDDDVDDEDAAVDVDDDADVDEDDDEAIDDDDVDDDDDDADAGVDDDDDNDEAADEAADDADADVDEDADEDADEAADEAADVDVDAGVDDEDAAADEVDVNADKEKLQAGIEACLDQARACVDEDVADAEPCVDAIEICVQAALDDVFESVCAQQLQNLDGRKVSKQDEAQLQSLCEQKLSQ